MHIPSGYAQVNLQFTGIAVPTGAEMAWGLQRLDSGMSPTDVAARTVDAWATAVMMQFQTDAIALTSVLCKFGPNDTGLSAEIGVSRPGTSSAQTVPPNVAALLQKSTSLGGRRGRGRSFLPGIPEGQVQASGVLDGGFKDDLDDSLAVLLGDLLLGDIPMVLLHDDSTGLLAPNQVTAMVCSSTVATQRRRLRR